MLMIPPFPFSSKTVYELGGHLNVGMLTLQGWLRTNKPERFEDAVTCPNIKEMERQLNALPSFSKDNGLPGN